MEPYLCVSYGRFYIFFILIYNIYKVGNDLLYIKTLPNVNKLNI